MPEKVEEVISNFIADLSKKFEEAKKSNGVTEKFLTSDVWECMKDFQIKCPQNNIGSDLPQFLIKISKNKVKNDINTIIEIIKYGISKLGNEQPKMQKIMKSILEEFKKPKEEPKKEETKTKEKNGEQNKEENVWSQQAKGFSLNNRLNFLRDYKFNVEKSPNMILQSFWSMLISIYKEFCNSSNYETAKWDEEAQEFKQIGDELLKINDSTAGNLKDSKFGKVDLKSGEIENESDIDNVVEFLRDTINKHSNSKFKTIQNLVKICKNALKAYSTAKAKQEKEKQKEEKQNAKNEKLSKTVFNNVKNCLVSACGRITKSKDGKSYECEPDGLELFQKAFEELKELAKMEMSEKSTSNKKGLAGWYNQYGTLDISQIKTLLYSFINIGDYVKGTGFLGLGKSRLKEIEKIVKSNKTKLNGLLKSL